MSKDNSENRNKEQVNSFVSNMKHAAKEQVSEAVKTIESTVKDHLNEAGQQLKTDAIRHGREALANMEPPKGTRTALNIVASDGIVGHGARVIASAVATANGIPITPMQAGAIAKAGKAGLKAKDQASEALDKAEHSNTFKKP